MISNREKDLKPHKNKSTGSGTTIKKTPKPQQVVYQPKPKPKPQVQLIPIDTLYNRLRSAIETRVSWQDKQKELWVVIKRNNVNRSSEMNRIDKYIGDSTYEIDKLLGELTKHRQRHNAMKLAYNYLTNEMERVSKIYYNRKEAMQKVDRGQSRWIHSDGSISYTNDKSTYNYIEKLENRWSRLNEWRKHVENYI